MSTSPGTSTSTGAGTSAGASPGATADPGDERLRRWRLVLGGGDAEGTGRALTGSDAAMDRALAELYGREPRRADAKGKDRAGGLGGSAPSVARWLGDIRTYFPSSVVQVMQRDAIDRLGLATLLLDAGEMPRTASKPANVLDLVGALLRRRPWRNGLESIAGPTCGRSSTSVFVNVFGGITACDEVANGIVQALELLASRGDEVTKPLVVRLDGNNAELGRKILSDANHPLVQRVDTMDGAADKAAELAAAK
ncbi:hypothetical protein SNARM312S_01456 [Streptomyces narbonensis]